ncbi:AAA domain-containing protein, putative AbiEii toxin, Type IV TA system [Salegentibacter agarivorans]|uniref:AAA domain-containing protein, putative AbiEii toxin, Type IV TA system n=1 Tax=Salegentibacter agarivorans TaxID=345907 RepID=A0A1I2NPI9_9FLAO|nr:AAA family ATPase [Salegentibacter agarivorans]SFG03356.1 AAA domain-containing protein, putative AbiEii toxin, Type IV TA system [Salegentibacter agarivorans]
MKFKKLRITNFKAIEFLELESLGDLVLIAGQNGVGKSCIFDCIRLFKSNYGSYNQNEVNNFYNEFQIKVGNQFNLEKLFRNRDKPINIKATIELSEYEINFLKKNGEYLLKRLLWRLYTKNPNYDPIDDIANSAASNQRMYGNKVDQEAKKYMVEFDRLIKSNEFYGEVLIFSDNTQKVLSNIVLEILFNTFSPDELGIIDYHGAHRNYQKENLQNLNLRFDNSNDNYQNHALYNYTNKYNNVKTEMASSYVKALIAKESGATDHALSDLNNSLSSLFSNFFPGKSFDGMIPNANGSLEFPVKIKTGEKHDIADLSSGEKEVLFGYLRLRNQAPKNSVILIDEPELHLNPKLAKKLPEFYYETIGKELGNQIWLVTHSDAILREVAGNKDYSIFHMSESLNDGHNQARKISLENEAEAALIDLIGEFSEYDQNNKIVIFEGEDSEFDKTMTSILFPEFENSTNSISAGSKTNVSNLQNVLKTAADEGIISKRFISIVDKDSSKVIEDLETLEFSWDAYHIENYLLNEEYILKVLLDLGYNKEQYDSHSKILDELKNCAKNNLNFHIQHELNQFVTSELQHSVTIKINDTNPLNEEYFKAIEKTISEIELKKNNILSKRELLKKEKIISNKFQTSLKDDSWKLIFNGRNILKCFTNKINIIRYEQFRNLIISKMKNEGYKPEGMKKVIDQILNIE